MATKRIPILFSGRALPETSGDVYTTNLQDPGSGGLWDFMVVVFTDSGEKDAWHTGFWVPEDYVGSADFDVKWTANATSGNVIFDLDYRTIPFDDTASIDQGTAEESDTVTDAAPSAAFEGLTATMGAITAGNFTAGEFCEVILYRDGANASDTLSASALVVDLMFVYADA